MKRVKLCSAILISLLIISFLYLILINHYNKKAVEMVEDIKYSIENEKTEVTLQKADELLRFFDKYYVLVGLFVSRDKVTSVTCEAAKLPPMIESNHDETLIQCEAIISCLNLLYQNETPKWYNIF